MVTEAKANSNSLEPSFRWRAAAAVLLLAAVLFGLRFGTDVLSRGPIFDEYWIRQPIDALIAQGWSVERAIDFEETKGPGMIWPYAWLGGLLGGSLNDLRLISLFFSILIAGPCLWLARRTGERASAVLLIPSLILLLPQQVVLSQLLMSEAIFIFGTLVLLGLFVWGMQEGTSASKWAPVFFAIVLSFLLHTRVHAVAYAGAACLLASWRLGIRSWPWWLASLLAGLSRLPLWHRWGGLVSPAYQDMHQLGDVVQLQQSTYLLAACTPFLGAFLLAAVWKRLRGEGAPFLPIVVGGVVGALAAAVAMPSLVEQVPLPAFVSRDGPASALKYLGLTATAARSLGSSPLHQSMLLGALAVLGSASIGALVSLSMMRPAQSTSRLLGIWTAWSLILGIAMYAMTAGFVFDRYLIPWCAAAPILWVRWLPRWLLAVNTVALAAVAAVFIRTWLL